MTVSVNERIEAARERLERTWREAQNVLAQLRLAVLASACRVESPFMTLAEAAAYTRLEPGTLNNAIYRGELAKQKRHRKVIIRRDELDRFMALEPPKKKRPRRGK